MGSDDLCEDLHPAKQQSAKLRVETDTESLLRIARNKTSLTRSLLPVLATFPREGLLHDHLGTVIVFGKYTKALRLFE